MKRIALLAVVLTVGAGSAMAATGSADRETQALNLLEAKGYGAFSDFRAAGQDYTATVMQNGHSMNVRVDPQSGVVTAQD